MAAGDAGEEFINKLHNITQANIAASRTLTGSAGLGGDWELEVTLGEGQFVPAFTSETFATYSSVLDSGESSVSKLPAFAQKWIDKNNPVPNVSITEADNKITAAYDGTLDITANINEILTKLKLENITQTISAENPTLVVQGTLENPTGYQFSVNQVPVGEIMNGLGELTNNADLFKGLSSSGNVDLVLSDQGVRVDYAEAVQLDINNIIDTSNVVDADSSITFVQNAIDNIEKALSGAATDATTIILENSSLQVTKDTEIEVKLESKINDETVAINYKTPTNLSFSLPEFNGVDLSNLLSDLVANIPGINLPNLPNTDWSQSNSPGLKFDFSAVDGNPDFKFTLPNLSITNLQSLFDDFGLSIPNLDFIFQLPNLSNLSLTMGSSLFQVGGLDLNFSDFLTGFGVNLPSLPRSNSNVSNLDITFDNGSPRIELPSIDKEFIQELFNSIDVDFVKELLNPILNEDKEFKIELNEDELTITHLGEINIRSIIETVSSEAGFNLDLANLTIKDVGLRIKTKEDEQPLYEVSVGEFSPGETVNFLSDTVGIKLPDTIHNKLNQVDKVALFISNQGLTLNYLDDITLDVNRLISSDGFLKDATNVVTEAFLGDGDDDSSNGTQLVLGTPEVEFTNKNGNKTLGLASRFNGNKFDLNFDVNVNPNVSGIQIPKLNGFEFELPELDATKLENVFKTIGETELPDFAKDLLAQLGSLANFDIELSDDEFAVTYLGTLNISNIVNSLAATSGISDNLLSESLSVTNPGLRIAKDNAGNKLYEISIGEFSPTEAINLLTNTVGVELPDTLENELNNVGKVGLSLSNQGLKLNYLDDVTIDINSLIDSDEFLNQAANTLTEAFLGDGDETTDGTQLVLAESQLEFLNKDDSKELSFAGNFNGTDFKFGYAFETTSNTDESSTSSNLGTPKLSQLEFNLPQLDATKLKQAFETIAGVDLPGFADDLLNALTSLSDFNLDISKEGLGLTYVGDETNSSGEFDISSILNSLSSALGIGENLLSEGLSIKNPGLRFGLDSVGNRLYQVSLGEFSPTEAINFLTQTVGIDALPEIIQSQLGKVGNVGLSASTQGFSLNYLDNITLDINSLIGSNDSLKDIANQVTSTFLGDGDGDNSNGTQLVLATPEVEFINTGGNKILSLASSFNGNQFDLNFDVNFDSNFSGTKMPQLSGFDFELPELDITQLETLFKSIAGTELPGFAKDLLNVLGSLNLSDFNIEVGEGELAVSYLGEVKIAEIVNSLSSTLGLGDSLLSESLSVTNPGLRIGTDNSGNKIYEVSIGEFSPTEAVNFLSDTLGVKLPEAIQNELNNVGKVALAASNQGFTLTYLDDVVVDVNSLINIEGIVQDAANAITKELLGDGDDAEGTQLVLAKPELEFTTRENTKELSFAGNFNSTDFKFVFDLNANLNSGSGSGLGSTSGSSSSGFSIPKLSGLEFDLPELDAEKTQNTLSSIAGFSLPSFTTSFLDKLASVGNNLQIGFNDGGFQLTSLGELDISSIIQKLIPDLSLDSLNVKNPGLTIESGVNGGLEFGVSIGEFSPGQLIDLLVDLLPDSVPFPNDIISKIKELGNASLSLSTEGISITYLEDLTLDLNSIIGDLGSIDLVYGAVEAVLGDADNSKDNGIQFELATPELDWKSGSLGLGGLLNDKEFNLGLKDGLELNYDIGELDLGSIVGLSGFNLDNSELSFNNGLNFTGALEFDNNPTGIAKFINSIGINDLEVGLNIGTSGASLSGQANTDITLFPILGSTLPKPFDDFKIALDNVNLGLNAGTTISGTVGGSITLDGYDPMQDGEPTLKLSGQLELEPNAFTGKFEMNAEGGAWKDVFGLPETEFRNITLQTGGTYQAPWLDNIGFIGDLKFGNYNFKSAVLVDSTNPNKFALELTLNEGISWLDLYLGPVYSYAAEVALEQADNVDIGILDKGINLFRSLQDIVNISVVSTDGDGDGELDPLIKFVPIKTQIFNTTLEQGIGVNAGVLVDKNIVGALNFNADIFSLNPTIEGSLKIPEIDVGGLGIVKISGVENPASGITNTDVNLDLEVSLSEQYFRGDGKFEFFGYEIAKADFDISPSGIKVAELSLLNDLLKLSDVEIVKDNGGIKATGKLNAFGQQLDATITGNSSGFTLESGLSFFIPLYGLVDSTLRIDATSSNPSVTVDLPGSSLDFSLTLSELSGSLDTVIDKAADEVGVGAVLETFNELADLGTETITSAINSISTSFNSSFSAAKQTFDTVINSIASVGNEIVKNISSIFGGGRNENDSETLVGSHDKNDKIDGHGGDDRIFGESGDDHLIGGPGNDELHGWYGTDLLYGFDGNDYLYVLSGNSYLDGGNGNDSLYAGAGGGNHYLDGGNGNDYLRGGIGNDWLEGNQGSDILSGEDGNDLLFGHQGNDSLYGGEGNDLIYGEDDGKQGQTYSASNPNNDTIDGGAGGDALYGGLGNDLIRGGNDEDFIDGGEGNDYLWGEEGNDTLEGGNGNDTLYGFEGDDWLDGGTGDDYLHAGFDSPENDTLEGRDGNDTLFGTSGHDLIEGGDGDDQMHGGYYSEHYGDDNDILKPGKGSDTIYGGYGTDIVILSGTEDDYTITETSTGQEITDKRDNSTKIVTGVELIAYEEEFDYFSNGFVDVGDENGNRFIVGDNNNDNQLEGGNGNDYLVGANYIDRLLGGNGDDTLKPGKGSDTIDGGEGDDLLVLYGTEDNYTIIETSTGQEIIDKRDNSKKIVTNVETITYEQRQDGSAANGPLAYATAFIDTNGNFQRDAGETQTTTDNNGEYSLPYELEELDRNGDGQVDAQEAQVVVTGGIDTTTGLPGTLPLISQISAAGELTTTSPLTTLKAVLASQDIEAEQVETLLNKISGFSLASLSQPLDNFDPYAAVGDDDASGIDIASGHIKIMNLFINGSAFLEAAGYQEADAQVQVIFGLSEILQTVDNFDFSQSNDLQTLFSELSQQLNLSVDSEVISAVSELVAESNNLVDNLVEEALSHAVSDVLPTINPIKQAVYSSLPEVTEQLVAGEITTEEAQTQLQDLLSSDTYLVQYALNENRTVTVSASNTVLSEENDDSETEGENSTSNSATVTEGEDSHGHFIITLGEAAPAQGLKILYTLSGTATLGQDYDSENGQFDEIIVAPGETEAVIDLTLLDDDIAERRETITINLRYVGDGYVLDPEAQSAVLDITDNDEANAADAETGLDQTGTSGDDTLVGTDAEDYLSGSYGDDMVFGQGGNDDIMGAAGEDTVFGGQGNDNIEGNFGADILHGNKGDDILAGGSDNDIIEGHEGSDQLQGDSGDDYLQGNEGNDVIKGGLGDDNLKGNQDNDWLIGGPGNDVLMGGQGVDLFNGGEGADVFFFNVAAEGGDLILDFDPTQGDKIQVSEIGFNTTSLDDFSFMAGTLYFQDEELALVQNNGQTYNHFADLSEILEIVSEPTRPEVENTAVLSANITPRVPDLNLVENPEITILDEIIQRGQITVATPVSGVEFDLEFARTLAAALFGDASKVETVTTTFDEAVSLMADGTVDLAARRSTETLGRDATLNVDFSPTYFYDHQAVVVRNDSGIDSILDLNGRTIGVLEGTTALEGLYSQLGAEGIEFIPQQFATAAELMAAYDQGLIDAYSRDRTLILDHLESLLDSANHRLLEMEFSKEPIALALAENDSQWADIVRWVNYVPIQAEEFGIDSQNIYALIEANTDENENNDSAPEIRRFLGLEGDLGEALGLPNDFAVQVIQQVGNYGEIYDRHFPELDRNQNLLWTDGGLLYSPPFSGSPIDGELVDNDSRNLLAEVLERGSLKLGLPGPGSNPGFAVQQEDGEYAGFDVDLGRAIAAAVFGDASKLEIETQSFKDSFANTANGVVDVSAMGITENLVRDASLGIDYSPTYLYTGQGILVKADSGIDMLPGLNGRRIGVLENATALQNLQDSIAELGGTFTPVTYGSNDELFAAYEAGEIDAVSTDMTILSARIPTLSNPEEHQLLDDVLSKEPLALITDENQSEWADVVRWVTHGLVQAEEYGITSENIDELIANNTDDNPENDVSSTMRQFLGLEGNIGASLGLSNDFIVNAIKAVGNYGEIYDRHFNSDLLRRGNNELATNFGLQYAPPFSGAGDTNLVAGTPEDDNLEGTNLSEHIYGYQGNDLIMAQDGSDLVYGGQGLDTVQAGNGNDYVWGNAGNDWLNGNPGNDRVDGGEGDDELYGGQGDDLLVAAAGNDTMTGGEGRDRFVLTPGSGSNVITDFTDGEDWIVLEEGLTFEQLTIEPTANATIIKLGDEILATLNGIDVSLINPDYFHTTVV